MLNVINYKHETHALT